MVYLFVACLVMVVLFFLMPKRAAWVLLGLTVILALLAGIAYWMDEEHQAEIDAITIELGMDQESCTVDKPLRYRIHNQGQKTVYRVLGRFSVYRQGYSTPLSKSYRNEFEVDKILEPSATFSGCIELPALGLSKQAIPPAELNFIIESQNVWFDEPKY